MTTIYALIDPRSGLVRYIGKTRRKLRSRLWYHIYDAKRGDRRNASKWIRGLLRNGCSPSAQMIEECQGNGCVEERFHIRIALQDGLKLCNHTGGGEDGAGPPHSEESKRRIGERQRQLWKNPEWRANIISKMKLFRHDAASRAKMSAARKGVPHTDAWKRKMSEILKGRDLTPRESRLTGVAKRRARGDKFFSAETIARSANIRRGKPRNKKGHPSCPTATNPKAVSKISGLRTSALTMMASPTTSRPMER